MKIINSKDENGTRFSHSLNGLEDDGSCPAVRFADGSFIRYSEGVLHGAESPAVYLNNGSTKAYFYRGKLHRVDGPALILPCGNELYFVNGCQVSNGNGYYFYWLTMSFWTRVFIITSIISGIFISIILTKH